MAKPKTKARSCGAHDVHFDDLERRRLAEAHLRPPLETEEEFDQRAIEAERAHYDNENEREAQADARNEEE